MASIERFNIVAGLSSKDDSRFSLYNRYQNVLASCRVSIFVVVVTDGCLN
jgi:hypothetical protein